tara:strand:- start:290 stop:592 length:303 start_codon:yes stop_codon:yes gene_type:complete
MKKEKYFPHRWNQYASIPAGDYEALPFDLLMEMKDMWELKRSYICVIRSRTKTGKVKEKSYQRLHAARKKVKELLAGDNEFTVLTYDAIHHINPNELFHL